ARGGRRIRTVDGRPVVSCGAPLDGVYVRIVDPNAIAVVRGPQIGEIWVRGGSACHEYWRRPALTAQTFGNVIPGAADPDTYLRTGDLGFMHDDELFVCGRIKDLI